MTGKSRYNKAERYTVTDHRGRTVTAIATPPGPSDTPLGIHLHRQGERTDHLAYKYLRDSEQSWRICEINNVMLPEALTEKDEIIIPK